jgi:hypothetical protein
MILPVPSLIRLRCPSQARITKLSSFIVRPETINRIVKYLDRVTMGNSMAQHSYERILKEHGFNMNQDDQPRDLAQKLFMLNLDAVKQRYPEENEQGLPGPIVLVPERYDGRYTEGCENPIRVYKSLQCLVYQCSEGNVPETSLYKMLEELEHALAYWIVNNLPEYDKAEWD